MRRTRKNCRTSALLMAAVGAWPVVAGAVDTTYIGPAAGNWDTAVQWNGGAPTGTSHAFIDSGNAQSSIVTIGTGLARSVGSLSISATDQLAISNGTILSLLGDGTNTTLTNGGTLSLNSTGSSTRLRFAVTGNGTLSGGGTILMSGTGAVLDSSSTARLFNLDNVIRGQGEIGGNTLAVTNQSLIQADVLGGTLTIDPNAAGLTNSGSFLATNGATLALAGGVFTNTGTFHAANGSSISLSSATLSGGTLSTAGTGVAFTADSTNGTLTNLTIVGKYVGRNSSNTFISGTITNMGTISIEATSLTDLELVGGSTVTLMGGGVVQLTGSSARLLGTGTLDNLNNTIRGQGALGVNQIAINNAGLITADVAAATLTLDASTGGMTNTNTVRAENGGILVLNGSPITNSGSFHAANGSTISLVSSTISGGVITTTGSGVIETAIASSGTLNNVTNTGHYIAQDNANVFVSGTITNSGSITVNSAGNLSDFELVGGSTLTLNGGGIVNLVAANSRMLGAGTLDNINNTIRGRGSVGVNQFALNNAGLISADINAATLTIDTSADALANSGTLRAENGGILSIGGTVITNTGTLAALNGSTISVTGSTINGGTLAGSGTGVIETAASSNGSLTNVTNTGHYVGRNFSNIFVSGTITNSGSISVISSPSLTDMETIGASTVTLTGGGIVNLVGANARILGAATLDNVNNTIHGQGQIGTNQIAVINRGVITADVGGATLTVDTNSDSLTNTGTLRAENGGILSLGGTSIVNSGTLVALNGSTISFTGSTINGGTLAGSGTGVIETVAAGDGTLTNITNTGHYAGRDNSNIFITGTITNNGSISVNPNLNLSDLELVGGSTVTLAGSGFVNLNGATARVLGSGTLVTSNHIRGVGTIGVNQTAIISTGTIEALPVGAHTTLSMDPSSGGMVNNGTLLASSGAQLVLQGGTFSGTGSLVVSAGGSLSTQGGAFVSAGPVVLNGTWNHSGTSADVTNVRGTGILNVTGGAVNINANGGPTGTSRVSAITTATGGDLNLADNDMVVDYTGATPADSIRTQLASAFNNGPWNGSTGITTSAGAAAFSLPQKTGIGYRDNTNGALTTFSGQPVDNTTVVMKYTYFGDLNLDGQVDITDLGTLATNWQANGLWDKGDMNYSGFIDITDLGLLATNWQAGVGSPLGPDIGSALRAFGLPEGSVPEPALAGLGVLAAWSIARPRPRRSRFLFV